MDCDLLMNSIVVFLDLGCTSSPIPPSFDNLLSSPFYWLNFPYPSPLRMSSSILVICIMNGWELCYILFSILNFPHSSLC